MNFIEIPCICDSIPKPEGAISWACSSPNCKYRNQDPYKLDKDFSGDFREYFNL